MYTLLIIIHVIVSIFLIAVILLQAGRGGGLADTFGGSQLQSLFGTRSTTVLAKLTTICASIFIITCLSLAIISSYRSKSLIERVNIPEKVSAVKQTTGGPGMKVSEEKKAEAPQKTAPEESQSNTAGTAGAQ